MGSNHLPEGYLEFCSLGALESLALSRMNRAAMLRTQVKRMLRQMIEAEAEEKIVCWMLQKRRTQEFRKGVEAATRNVANPAAVRNASFFGAGEASSEICSPPIDSISVRSLPSASPSARRAAEERPVRRPATPLRGLRSRRRPLNQRARRSVPAWQSGTGITAPIGERVELEMKCDEEAAAFHRTLRSQAGSTERYHRRRKRREEKGAVLIRPIEHGESGSATRQPGAPPTVPGSTRPHAATGVAALPRAEHVRLLVLRMRTVAECRLVSAS
jgi:hypothetical protein